MDWTEGLWIMAAALGASAGAAAAAVIVARVLRLDRVLGGTLRKQEPPEALIERLAGMADLAHREGLLSLERHVAGLRDKALQAGVGLAVEGAPAPRIAEVIQTKAGLAGFEKPCGVAAFFRRHPQSMVLLGASLTLLVIGLSWGGTMAPWPAGAALVVLLAGMGVFARTSASTADPAAAAARALGGMIRAQGVALIRQGRDGQAVRAALLGLLPTSAGQSTSRAKAA